MAGWLEIKGRLAAHPLARVGTRLITGVADDDPSGIATYSQAGAQFGLNMLWTMPLTFPLMAAVQSICGRIGRVTGTGLAFNIKQSFPALGRYHRRGLVTDCQYAQHRGGRRHDGRSHRKLSGWQSARDDRPSGTRSR